MKVKLFFLFVSIFVPANLPSDRTRVFIDFQDMVDWYLTMYREEVELEKDPAMMVVESALHNFSDKLNRDLAERWLPSSADFSVGVDGYIDPHMVCALSSLIYISNNQKGIPIEPLGCSDDSSGVGFDFMPKNVVGLDFMPNNVVGSDFMPCNVIYGNHSMLSIRLAGLSCRSKTMHGMDSGDDEMLKLVLQALKKRLLTILELSSSTLEEDEVLMEASLWEGFSDNEGGSHLCETCQWQTEELNVNDFLAVQLRVRRKQIVSHVLALVQNCSLQDGEALDMRESVEDDDVDYNDHTEAIVEFLKWCEAQGANISEALEVTRILLKTSLFNATDHVQGLKALRDIEQGETLCALPLEMGLFDWASSHIVGEDSWHLAAARLLREKSLGVKSKWASYVAILPRMVQSPFYLMPSELKEIQWWPVLRELIQVRRAVKESFAQLAGPELAFADFEDYKWAVMMVHSRAFMLPVDDDDEEYVSYVLMPFMDMINHHHEYQADWMSVPVRDGKLEIIAKRRVEKGRQLYATYGPRSNDDLFLYYGFVMEDNPFDSAQIFVSFQDAVCWMLTLWESNCDEYSTIKEREQCKHKTAEQKWSKAQRAIDDYAAGIPEQKSEWWNLVNLWADHGYEDMQFQSSPSIYAGGIIDPTLLAALEAVMVDLIHENKIVRRWCKSGECNSSTVKMNLKDFFACLVETRWTNAEWLLHSSLCSESLSQALTSANESTSPTLMVKVSLSLRCVDILNSLPTTIEEDKALLKDKHASMHVELARRYRYIKKIFLKDFIAHIIESI